MMMQTASSGSGEWGRRRRQIIIRGRRTYDTYETPVGLDGVGRTGRSEFYLFINM